MSVRFKLDYREFPAEPCAAFPQRRSALRPAVPITLINGDEQLRYFALVDSGADFCIFHAEVGEQIGLDIESGKKLEFSGIEVNKGLTAYFHQIDIQVGGYKFGCYAGFSKDLEGLPYGLLGQVGFFDLFKISFEYGKERLELQSIE